MFSATFGRTGASLNGGYCSVGKEWLHMPVSDTSTQMTNSALIWTWPLYSLPSTFRHLVKVGYFEFYFKVSHHYKVLANGVGKRGRADINHLYLRSLSQTSTHTHTYHIVHTFYILGFSFLSFLWRVCCHLMSLPLSFYKAHRGADSVAPLAWVGSSLLSSQQSHLSQDRAVDTQLRLLTQNLCHADGSGKGSLCEG